MTKLFFLAHKNALDAYNVTDVFTSLDHLVRGLEARDVEAGTFKAFCSDGRSIDLQIMPNPKHPRAIDLASVHGTLSNDTSNCDEYKKLVERFVFSLAEEGSLPRSASTGLETSIEELVDALQKALPSLSKDPGDR